MTDMNHTSIVALASIRRLGLRIWMMAFTLIVFFSTENVVAQTDLNTHVRLLKQLMPDATRIGLIHNSGVNVDAAVQRATSETGIRVIKAPVRTIRDIAQAIRSLDRYEVNLVILVEERIVTSNNSIKFVVKQTVKKKIPVFSTAPNALSAGAYGRFYQDQGSWRIEINGKMMNRYDVQIPEGSDRFKIGE